MASAVRQILGKKVSNGRDKDSNRKHTLWRISAYLELAGVTASVLALQELALQTLLLERLVLHYCLLDKPALHRGFLRVRLSCLPTPRLTLHSMWRKVLHDQIPQALNGLVIRQHLSPPDD
jgi:hypothetical protein